MKYINSWPRIVLISLITIHCLLFITPARAQVGFGLKGGFQLANMEFNDDALKKSNRMGFFIGPTIKIGLPVTGLAIDVAGLYDQRDLKIEGENFKQQSIILQGDARFGAGLGDALGIFIMAGPQFSFNVGDDVKQWFGANGELNQFALQETMLSVNFGLGVTFAGHFEGAVHYNVPVSKTADFTWQQLGDQLQEQVWSHSKTRTNAWSISLSYYF